MQVAKDSAQNKRCNYLHAGGRGSAPPPSNPPLVTPLVSWVALEWCLGLVWSGVMGWSGVGSWVCLVWCHGLVWSGVMG